MQNTFLHQYKSVTLTLPANQNRFVRDVKVNLPSKFGVFTLYSYSQSSTGEVHLAIVKGEVANKTNVPVRVHSSCITGDILGSQRCDCRDQLIKALKLIEKKGCGVVIYAFQEGRGIGLVNKLKAYYLQETGLDTVEANTALGFDEDLREYSFVADILCDLNIYSIELITNNPDKVYKLKQLGIKIERRLRHEIPPCVHNKEYLRTKKNKMKHKLSKYYYENN